MHYSSPLRESHDNWIIEDNDGRSNGHFPEIQTHNILNWVGTFYCLLTYSLDIYQLHASFVLFAAI